jgi:hypothetical protein
MVAKAHFGSGCERLVDVIASKGAINICLDNGQFSKFMSAMISEKALDRL